jgi:molybdopterin synthase catalytic subunit
LDNSLNDRIFKKTDYTIIIINNKEIIKIQSISMKNIHPQDHFSIRFVPLSLDEVYQLADHPANGAIVIMSGTVRKQTDGKAVNFLEYQSYEPMALNVFQKIAQDIRQTWPDTNTVIIHHRTGKLKIGEISVLVAVGCPHRQEAFEACRYAIDTLKHNAPIWKKEHWLDGSSEWVSIGACETEECII